LVAERDGAGHPARAEHDDLEILRLSRSEQKEDKLQDALKGDVNDEHEHGTSATEKPLFYADRITAPHTRGCAT
jgi:hypothetical protein